MRYYQGHFYLQQQLAPARVSLSCYWTLESTMHCNTLVICYECYDAALNVPAPCKWKTHFSRKMSKSIVHTRTMIVIHGAGLLVTLAHSFGSWSDHWMFTKSGRGGSLLNTRHVTTHYWKTSTVMIQSGQKCLPAKSQLDIDRIHVKLPQSCFPVLHSSSNWLTSIELPWTHVKLPNSPWWSYLTDHEHIPRCW